MCQPLGHAVQVQFEGSYRIVSIVVLPSKLLLTFYKKSEVVAIKLAKFSTLIE